MNKTRIYTVRLTGQDVTLLVAALVKMANSGWMTEQCQNLINRLMKVR